MDKYTKIILTVIAILLAGNMWVIYEGADTLRYATRQGLMGVGSDISIALNLVADRIDDCN